jgi:hypothetical protein
MTIDNAAFYEPLTVFLYKLLRDEMPIGKVEQLVEESVKNTEKLKDGSILAHARGLASLFYINLNKTPDEDIEQMEHDFADFNKVLSKIVEESVPDNNINDLKLLEQQIIKASKAATTNKVQETPENIKQNMQAKLQELLGSNIINTETAGAINDDINEILSMASKQVLPGVERTDDTMAKDMGIDMSKFSPAEKIDGAALRPRSELIDILRQRAEKMREDKTPLPTPELIDKQLKEIEDVNKTMEDLGLKQDYGTFVETWEQNNTNDINKAK